jgi:excisionase family DNA binding protein
MAVAKSHGKLAKKPPRPNAPANGVARQTDVLTLDEAAAYLRVAPDEVLRMIDAQAFPGRKFDREWRFLKSALQEWLSQPPGKKGLLNQLGKIKDDPFFQEMLQEIYERRGRPESMER